MFFQSKKIHFNYALILFTVAVACEILARWDSTFGVLGVFTYLFLFIPLIILSLRNLKQLIRLSFKYRSYFSLGVLLIFVFLLIGNIFLPQNIGGESTQEINCTLNHFANSPDAGYLKTCLFGYPAKQYFLPSLVSWFFGRSRFNLHFGNSLYFLIALPIFVEGLRNFSRFRRWKKTDLFIALSLSLFFHFFYFNHFLFRQFEQSIYPLCLLMLLIGLFLQYLARRSDQLLVLIAFAITLSIFAYTPGLATAFLALAVWVYAFLFKKTHHQKQAFYLLILLALMLISSFSYRADVNLLSTEERDFVFYLDQLQKIFEHLLFANQGKEFISFLLNPILIITWIYHAFQHKNRFSLLLSWWILGTIILATVAQGYAFYGLDFRMHRALVVAPAWILLMFMLLQKIKIKRKFLTFIFFFYLLTGIYYQMAYISSNPVNQHWLLINWFERILPDKTTGKITLAGESLDFYLSLNDELQYFYPYLRTQVAPDNFAQSCRVETEYLLIEESNPCKQNLLLDPKFNVLAVYKLNSPQSKFRVARSVNFYLFEKK